MARLDYPEVNCEACKQIYQTDSEDPLCFNGICPVGNDTILPEEKRLLEIRSLLISLYEFRIGIYICEEYSVTRQELNILAEFESESKKLDKDKGHKNG